MTKLDFGIPSLNFMLDSKDVQGVDCGTGTLSACIAGPAGTGKSALALHLAAHYAAQLSGGERASVLYASTDLSKFQADNVWKAFMLGEPARAIPIKESNRPVKESNKPERTYQHGSCRSSLDPLSYDPGKLADFVEAAVQGSRANVGFIDLQRSTAGDDWGFLNRLVAVLSPIAENEPKHMLIIDAVEGLEAFAGDVDSFGIQRARRSRVTQVLRTAVDKCHIIFVTESLRVIERDPAELPEEYVTDIVVRLRNADINQYRRRVIEVLKVRGSAHVRGEHQLLMRNGKGSTTGDQVNPDDPVNSVLGDRNESNAYVHVIQSILSISRSTMRDLSGNRQLPPKHCFAGFGIPYLDLMLAGPSRASGVLPQGPSGLPVSTVTALVGDDATQKTRLGHAFVANAFAAWSNRFLDQAKTYQKSKSQLDIPMPLDKAEDGAGIYICTHDIHVRALADLCIERLLYQRADAGKLGSAADWAAARQRLSEIERERVNRPDPRPPGTEPPDWLVQCWWKLRTYIEGRLVCRRLEIHDVSSALLAHVVHQAVFSVQSKLMEAEKLKDPEERYKQSWRIRVVIDDFRMIRETYPEVRGDPLFLPYLRFFLGREGVTGLIIDSHPGRPGVPPVERFDSELRTVVDNRLFTWRIPFVGFSRVAIAAIPPVAAHLPALVRELKSDSNHPWDPVYVDPRLELWDGLIEGEPKRVPLRVELIATTPAARRYVDQLNEFLLAQHFQVAYPLESRTIASGESSYEILRSLCFLGSDIQLDQTIVFSVDEFWGTSRKTVLRDCAAYLEGIPTKSDPYVDPHGVWGAGGKAQPKLSLFNVRDYDLKQGTEGGPIDRIPFAWDFGFLLYQEVLWREAFRYRLDKLQKAVATAWRLPDINRDVANNVNTALKQYESALLDARITSTSTEASSDAVKSQFKSDEWISQLSVRQLFEAMRFLGQKYADGPRRMGRPLERETVAYGAALDAMGISLTSWRAFLEACVVTARHCPGSLGGSPILAFDVDMVAPETFSCLVLEMWLSECKGSGSASADALGIRGEKRDFGLCKLLENSADELFLVFLLLTEAFQPSQFSGSENGFEFGAQEASRSAVAARHWYSTACRTVGESGSEDRLFACRLPGNFSVRGDWFLAVPRGSRSDRLADEALDLLSSGRANFDRLQYGIGLPTRQILASDEENDNIRTYLAAVEKSSRDPGMTYGGLLRLGAVEQSDSLPRFGAEFAWIWRSQLESYENQAGVWLKSLWRLLRLFMDKRHEQGTEWRSGFDVYDSWRPGGNIPSGQADDLTRNPTTRNLYEEFRTLIRALKQLLSYAS